MGPTMESGRHGIGPQFGAGPDANSTPTPEPTKSYQCPQCQAERNFIDHSCPCGFSVITGGTWIEKEKEHSHPGSSIREKVKFSRRNSLSGDKEKGEGSKRAVVAARRIGPKAAVGG